MTSPFEKHRVSTAQVSEESMRDWCHASNLHPLSERMERWYFVTEKFGHFLIDSLDGTDGGNVRRELDGRLPDFQGWPADRMTGYRRWLRSVANKGLRESSIEQSA